MTPRRASAPPFLAADVAAPASFAAASGPGTSATSGVPPSFLMRRSSARACALVSLRCSWRRFLYGGRVVIVMCACSAVSSSFSFPYASLRYWMSFSSRTVGSAMSLLLQEARWAGEYPIAIASVVSPSCASRYSRAYRRPIDARGVRPHRGCAGRRAPPRRRARRPARPPRARAQRRSDARDRRGPQPPRRRPDRDELPGLLGPDRARHGAQAPAQVRRPARRRQRRPEHRAHVRDHRPAPALPARPRARGSAATSRGLKTATPAVPSLLGTYDPDNDERRTRMSRRLWIIASAALLAVCIAPFALAAGEGRPVDGGARNPSSNQSQSYTRETQIIANNSTYGTRQSNKSDNGGGAIYGCRSGEGGSGKGNEPCVRANNLAKGHAFEFATAGAVGGSVTGGGGRDRAQALTAHAARGGRRPQRRPGRRQEPP